MLKEYLQCLYRQFCAARGLSLSNNISNYSKEFIHWLSKNQLLLGEYADYLKYLEIGYDNPDTVEIGKGRYDTLIATGINVISPYANTISKANKNSYLFDSGQIILSYEFLLTLPEERILTHNPYSSKMICGWDKLHNSGKSISIGMFGLVSDCNAKEKIETLSLLTKTMNDDYTFNFDTDKDRYFCSLNSANQKKLVLAKRK